MRAARILLIIVVVVGGLFVAADRIAVNVAEGKAADEVRSTQNLSETPKVSIGGFPFLTQVAAGRLDDVGISIKDYDASTGTATGGGSAARKGPDTIHLQDLDARMHGVTFSGSFGSATADTASGSALIAYSELLKTAQVDSVPVAAGVSAKVIRLSDGGGGKMKVTVEAKVLGRTLPQPVTVMSSMHVDDDVVTVHADSLPSFMGVPTPESRVRRITDFQQSISGLPDGIHIDKVEAAPDGVHISVTGSHVRLAG